MYSTRSDLDDAISVIKLEGVTVRGDEVKLSTRQFGLRPAEIVGELARFEDDSVPARYLAQAYANLEMGPPIRELRIVRGYFQLEGGRPVDYFEKTVAVWRRSN